MKCRKRNPMIGLVLLAVVFGLIITPSATLPLWAAETPVMQEANVPMRDGVLLFTKIFLPDPSVWGSGPYPTILSTTPYGVGVPGAVPTSWPNEPLHGYAFVYQDTRGRNSSQGLWDMFTDGQDGYDTVEWIYTQPFCNGCKIGMTGGSAVGVTTYQTAGQAPPHLVAIQPDFASADFYNKGSFEGQAYGHEQGLPWLYYVLIPYPPGPGLSASSLAYTYYYDTTYLGISPAQFYAAYTDWYIEFTDVFAHTPYGGGTNFPLPVTSTWWMHLPLSLFTYPGLGPFLPFSNITFEHPDQDAFRESWNVEDKIQVPGLHVGGWYDIFSVGILSAYDHTQKNVGNQKLIMYNGGHNAPGGAAPIPYDPEFRWFDYWLKGIDNGIMDEPPILYFRMTDYATFSGDWLYADQWPLPDADEQNYYLHSDGTLSGRFPNHKEISKTYSYDPNNPVPTMGGRTLWIPAGALDQTTVEPPNRQDVLVYTGDVLKKDVEVSGRVKVFLNASSNCTDTDFTAKLIDVYPDGSTKLIVDGVLRARYWQSFAYQTLLNPGQKYQFVLDLGDTSQVFKAGHRIQVDVSSSNFPRRDRNTNTGNTLYLVDTNANAIVAQNTIYHDAQHPSFVVLPIVDQKTRVFEGTATIQTPSLNYSGNAELYTLAEGVYLFLKDLNKWLKWDIEDDHDNRFGDHKDHHWGPSTRYDCTGKLGELSVWVHTEGPNPHAFARGNGVLFTSLKTVR